MSTVRIVTAHGCAECERVKELLRLRRHTIGEIPADWVERQHDRDEIQAAIAANNMALPVLSIDGGEWGAWHA